MGKEEKLGNSLQEVVSQLGNITEEYKKELFKGILHESDTEYWDLIAVLADDRVPEDIKEKLLEEVHKKKIEQYFFNFDDVDGGSIFKKFIGRNVDAIKAKKEEMATGIIFLGTPIRQLNNDHRSLYDTYKNDNDAMEKFSKIIHNKAKGSWEFHEENLEMTDKDIAVDVSEGGAVQAIKELNTVSPGWRLPKDVKRSFDKYGHAKFSEKSDFDRIVAVMPGESDTEKFTNFLGLTRIFGRYYIVTKNILGSKFMIRCLATDLGSGRSKYFKSASPKVRAIRDLAV